MAIYKDVSNLLNQIEDFKNAKQETKHDYIRGYVDALIAVQEILKNEKTVIMENV